MFIFNSLIYLPTLIYTNYNKTITLHLQEFFLEIFNWRNLFLSICIFEYSYQNFKMDLNAIWYNFIFTKKRLTFLILFIPRKSKNPLGKIQSHPNNPKRFKKFTEDILLSYIAYYRLVLWKMSLPTWNHI